MSTTFKQRLQRFATRFQRRPIWQDKGDLTIKPVFVLAGKQYYEVPGFFNYPYARAMAARDALMELDARVTKEYLIEHTEAIKKILSDAKTINILEISKLYNELDQRLKWIASPGAIYKLAGIVYFDENESPYQLNWQYVNEKIELWKKHNVADFFLREPIKRYIPYSELLESGIWKSENDLVDYIKTAIQMESLQKENLSRLKSSR